MNFIGLIILVIILIVVAWLATAPRKPKPVDPAGGHYGWASYEDRLAERAMVHFMDRARLQPDSLDMDFAKVARGAYRMAKFMIKARSAK